MKLVLQRVSEASVTVGSQRIASIGPGLLLLVAFTSGDGDAELDWVAKKVLELRVFNDADGRMNRSLGEVEGEVLVVSQFTLYGDVRKGRRPSFVRAAPPQSARDLYDRFVALLKERAPGPVAEGEFGARMHVSLVNDGPVTLVIERGSA
jgi:D-tyrosyl-tRNA(Tyr) deacylase